MDHPDSLAENIVHLLIEKKLTLSLAESMTGGLVSEILTRVAGSSAAFKGGIVSYSDDLKKNLLGVQTDTLCRFGAVSREAAEEMAHGARIGCDSDLGLSLTGFAGPGGGEIDKPVGTFFLGFSTKNETISLSHFFQGQRLEVRAHAAIRALKFLKEYLADLP